MFEVILQSHFQCIPSDFDLLIRWNGRIAIRFVPACVEVTVSE